MKRLKNSWCVLPTRRLNDSHSSHNTWWKDWKIHKTISNQFALEISHFKKVKTLQHLEIYSNELAAFIDAIHNCYNDTSNMCSTQTFCTSNKLIIFWKIPWHCWFQEVLVIPWYIPNLPIFHPIGSIESYYQVQWCLFTIIHLHLRNSSHCTYAQQ